MRKLFVLKIESYEGEDTFLRCGNESQNYLYSVALLTEDGALEIVDNGYRTAAEAMDAWKDAIDSDKLNV